MARRYNTAPTVLRMDESTVSQRRRADFGIDIQRGSLYKSSHPKKSLRVQRKRKAVGHLPSPESDEPNRKRKRRDSQTEHIDNSYRSPKRPRSRSPHTPGKYGAEVNWEEYDIWADMEYDQDRRRGRRSTSTRPSVSRKSSYSQSVRNGDSPSAWTRQHEERMEKAGLIMREFQTANVVTIEVRAFCDDLLRTEYSPPTEPSFQTSRLLRVLDSVRYRNEKRIVRDITPLLVPSPELLHIDGHPGVELICEAMDAEWTQASVICGPRPKPDFVVGISANAFTLEETEKLRLVHTPDSPNLFPEAMYYPFLVCEVKGSDRSLQEADRQSMHSASIAIKAIIQLYKKISATDQVHRKILAFSVAHNNLEVKVFGHFASIDGDKTRFFRLCIYSTSFATVFGSPQWCKTYNLTLAIYEKFFPEHLERVRFALRLLRARAVESVGQELAYDENSSQGSLQDDGSAKRVALESIKVMEKENERLRNDLRAAESERQRQMTAMERQMEQQREITDRQLKASEEQMKQQRETSDRQLKALEEQMVQSKEIIELLKKQLQQ